MSKKNQSYKNEHEKIFYEELDQCTTNGKYYKDSLFEWIDWALSLFEKRTDEMPLSGKEPLYYKMLQSFGTLSEDYTDALGEVFMDKISHGQNDQYFTPKHICELMALTTNPIGNNETIMDSACGSGRTLLAGLKVSRQNGIEPIIMGNDIDLMCCKMALLNMIIQTAQGEIWHGNMLSNEIWKVFKIERYNFKGTYISIWHETPAPPFSLNGT
jgi:type I restriction-modification system DNA methylase subunit